MSLSTGVPTRADAIARAESLVPVLRERARETDSLRQLPDKTLGDLAAAGLFRIANPPAYGGSVVDFDSVLAVTAELARGCGSTGWNYANWMTHSWMMGLFNAQAQAEYFADSLDTFACAVVNPAGAKIDPARAGYQLSGRWDFASGVDGSSWAILGGKVVEVGQVMILVPKHDFSVLDNWHVSGLRGTGSKTIVMNDCFVPAHRVITWQTFADGDVTGDREVARAAYRLPGILLGGLFIAAAVLGMAQGAMDAFIARTQNRIAMTMGGQKYSELPSIQLRVAESSAEILCARLMMEADIAEILALAESKTVPSISQRVRYARDRAYMGMLAVRATNRLFDASGANGIFDKEPIQRFHRDVHAGSHQPALNWDAFGEYFGRAEFGHALTTAGVHSI